MTLKELKDYLNSYDKEYDNLEVKVEDEEWGFCSIHKNTMGLCENDNGVIEFFVIGTV